jgi:large subunit ribosomal protein L10
MAISKDKKTSLVAEFAELLSTSKMTVGAQYDGLTVADLQQLRREARESGITIKVVKNRLVRVALSENPTYKDADTSLLTGQLLYAISDSDEVAPAQVLAKFAKTHDPLKLVCGFDADGNSLDTARVTALANLPTKDQLRGMLVGTIAGPLSGVVGVLSGNLRSVMYTLNARAEKLEA